MRRRACARAQGGFPGLPGPGSAGGGGATAGGAGPGGAAPGGVPTGAGSAGPGASSSALAAQSQLPQNGAPQAPGGGGGGGNGGGNGGGGNGGGSNNGGGGSPVISAVAFDGFLSDCTARARPPRLDRAQDGWGLMHGRDMCRASAVKAVACGSQPCPARVGAVCCGRRRLPCGTLLAGAWEPGERQRTALAPQQRATAPRQHGGTATCLCHCMLTRPPRRAAQVILGSQPHDDGTFDRTNTFTTLVSNGAWSVPSADAARRADQVAYIVPAAKGAAALCRCMPKPADGFCHARAPRPCRQPWPRAAAACPPCAYGPCAALLRMPVCSRGRPWPRAACSPPAHPNDACRRCARGLASTACAHLWG